MEVVVDAEWVLGDVGVLMEECPLLEVLREDDGAHELDVALMVNASPSPTTQQTYMGVWWWGVARGCPCMVVPHGVHPTQGPPR